VQVVVGGLERLNEDGSDGTLIANAIITVSVDDGTEGSRNGHFAFGDMPHATVRPSMDQWPRAILPHGAMRVVT
jgi:hypothetical protein